MTQDIQQGNNDNIDLLKAFQDSQTKNEIAEVLKELFVESKIHLITDLSKDEIRLSTRIYMIADMKNLDSWKSGLLFYFKLMLSKNRQSRRELLEAIKGASQHESMFSKMNPFKRRGF